MVQFMQFTLILALVYGAIVLFMYLRQESFIFFPTEATYETEDFTNVVPYSYTSGETELRGYLVNPQYRRDNLIIYYGGNAEDVFLNIEEFSAVQAASLFVAYRGYGPSEGSPGEQEIFSDSLLIFDDLIKKYRPEKIFLMGRSLGSGVAVYVAAKREVTGLILVTPYDSLTNTAKDAYPWLPVGKLLRHRFDSLSYIKEVKAPVLIMYGGRDRVVRPDRTRRLLENVVGEKEELFLDRADHGTIDMYPEYWSRILQFIQ